MKRILILLSIIVSIVIISNFVSSSYRLWHKKDLVTQAQQELQRIEKENADLKKQLAHVKNPDFVEEQARDKLFLVRPGENTVVIPRGLLPTPTPATSRVPQKPHWQKWLHLFWK